MLTDSVLRETMRCGQQPAAVGLSGLNDYTAMNVLSFVALHCACLQLEIMPVAIWCCATQSASLPASLSESAACWESTVPVNQFSGA